jgi:hypothetical protein
MVKSVMKIYKHLQAKEENFKLLAIDLIMQPSLLFCHLHKKAM